MHLLGPMFRACEEPWDKAESRERPTLVVWCFLPLDTGAGFRDLGIEGFRV